MEWKKANPEEELKALQKEGKLLDEDGTYSKIALHMMLLRDGKMYEWISVEDRLPEIDQYVLWYHEQGHMMIWEIDKDMDWPWIKSRFGDALIGSNMPTHWMPLPPPPEAE